MNYKNDSSKKDFDDQVTLYAHFNSKSYDESTNDCQTKGFCWLLYCVRSITGKILRVNEKMTRIQESFIGYCTLYTQLPVHFYGNYKKRIEKIVSYYVETVPVLREMSSVQRTFVLQMQEATVLRSLAVKVVH